MAKKGVIKRRRKYSEDYVELARDAFQQGSSVKQFADNLGVAVTTIYSWREKFPDFKNAMDAGRDYVNIEIVESELLKNCKDRILWKKKEIKNKAGDITSVHKISWLQPGDVGAQKFFLMNRTTRWTDKLGIDHGEGRQVEFNIQINADDKTHQEEIRGGTDHGEAASESGPGTRH